ncbi:mucin-19 [Anopheles maculipalpis]|uniref:mucin-19 n=1 Tax=Anopheles maculipalpis TaxID=1496333 RepID=UPI002159A815|nr:mucin-19 [Anopheles maculipalpis]
MAAARPDNGSKQDGTTIQPMQRPKPPQQPLPALPANHYPTFFLNARKQVTRSPVPHVIRRLAPTQPRRPLPSVVPTVVTGNSNGGALLISADSLRRTVYATLPSVSLHGTSTVGCNGLTNTIVSFAGKQAITVPVQSTYDLVSVVRPTVPTPPATIYKLVHAGSGPTGRKRMPLLAPKPAPKDGAQKSDQPSTVDTPNGVNGRVSSVQYNNAPGWRRILRNKVIIYISPSNMVLHNYEQVKEYLLSSGTCKCGLPCPFNPEQFFQFDAQIPNMTIAPTNREVLCPHLQRATNGPERTKRLHEESTPPAADHTHQRTAQSGILRKTPPWRKNVPMASASSPHGTIPDAEVGPNVSPIARFSKPTDVTNTPPFTPTSPSDMSVSEGSPTDSPERKKPTFKDDPTGYLNQQTAILHNSISFLHSPDRRSPLPSLGGLSPKPGSISPAAKPLASPSKDGGQGAIRRHRTTLARTVEPQAKITSLTGVVKYEPNAPTVTTKSPATSSIKAIKSPLARLATGAERNRMAYYVKANAAPGAEQCPSAKVAKLHIAPAESVIPCRITATTTTTTTTTAAPMFVPTPPPRSSHVINAGGAQIVVIDGLQHSAVGGGTDGTVPGRMRIGAFPSVTARHPQISGLMPPTVSKPTVVNYSLSRAVNGTPTTVPVPVPVSALSSTPMPTTTSGAMILNGANIIHLSNGLSPSSFHGGILTNEPSSPAGTNHCLHHPVSPNKASITIPNGTLGLAPGSTVVLNPTTSIRFADNHSFTTPGGFSTATVTSNTYHYSPAQCATVQGADTPVALDIAGGRKVKRQLKNVNGTPLGTTGGLVLPATLGQPQSATFQQQLQPTPFVQIASPYGGLQNIQLASSLSGLTVVPVSKSTPTLHQQQPSYGLLGQPQTILLPAGSMVMASDASSATATLLQIQNMAPCGGNASLLAGQTGLVLRHPKPPSTTGFLSTLGQQSYLIGAGGNGPTTRPPTNVNQRPLVGTLTTSTTNNTPGTPQTLFGNGANGGGLGIVTATQPLPVANLALQQPLHPDVTASYSQPASSGEGANETKIASSNDTTGTSELKPNTVYQQGKTNCVSTMGETEPVPGIAITLKDSVHATAAVEQQKKSWQGAAKQHGGGVPLAETPNRAGRNAPPPASATGRTGSIGLMRRSTTVQASNKQQLDQRVKLSIAVPSATTDGSTCLLTDVLPEQNYDVTTSLNEHSTTSKRSVEPCKGPRQFRVGDLVWGAVRGFPAWPGKVVLSPRLTVDSTVPSPTVDSYDNVLKASPPTVDTIKPASVSSTGANAPQQDHVWVRWFGAGRASAERVEVETLQSLSEGLEIHHRAQKDARKSRKLNAQLEQAIQQAMQELDHAATSSGFGRCASERGKQRQHRRHQRRQPPPPGKRHRTVGGATGSTNSVNANMCNRKGGSIRYLRANKFKAKS